MENEGMDNITDEILDIQETPNEENETTSIAESIDDILVQRQIYINLFSELLNFLAKL